MSGKPYPEGVELFRAALERMSVACSEIERLNKSIADQKFLLEEQSRTYNAAHTELFELMKEMDVHSSHNYGYEGRMSWFLQELYKQFTRGIEGGTCNL